MPIPINKTGLFLCVCALFMASCGATEKDTFQELTDQIYQLESNDEKRIFLEKIVEDDQRVRGSEGQELKIKFGTDSEEYWSWVEQQLSQDEINLFKVENYLAAHGYPELSDLGSKAASAPCMVIHHAQGYDARERNFEILYEAYLNKNLNETSFSFYLGRMYQMKFGERMHTESPFREEDRLNMLMEKLELIPMKEKVEMKIATMNY